MTIFKQRLAPDLGSPEFWQSLADSPERLAAEVCFVDLVSLEEQLAKHASLHAWVNAAHETAAVAEERAKWELTKTEARVLLTAKGTPDVDTKKAKTVDVLKAEVAASPDVEQANIALFATMEKRGALRAMAKALDDRKDMLVQIAAKQRSEKENY